ncbi:hypothetical protein Ndes2526B_g04587 [Nannochloris sp. 'desiccata']|nr:hypothetical protein KSW81_000686 [Chlorella desiccata (nom. nud.)]KAH7615584.1 putative Protein SDS23 [Chlorella desiccata (nom. nud.)]KAH7615826.1 putative Protein SDS23 [Chlorella desiccata (nom. nud.)]KAH7620662.1 putative Protein SDS23 [Chlorella desiccata (nom. nud.)]
MTVGDALSVLAKNDILSAPLVMQADLEDSGDINMSPSLLGWLDIQDILAALLLFLRTCGHEIPMKMLALMTSLEKEGPKFAKKTLVTIRAADDRGLMYQADSESTSVLTAIKDLFLQTAHGEPKVAHRIALFNAHGEVTSIISQMDVARWLLTQEAHMGPVAQKSIRELGMLTGKPPVVSVSPHMPTLMAYDLMAQEGVSGAPVVTDEGELIANISVSDLRALTSEHFGVLALPVAEFLALEHNTAYIGYSVNASDHSKHPFFASSKRTGGTKKNDIQLYTLHPTSTLLQTLHAFVDTHIHRLYVTTPGSDVLKVESVLTLTDVLRLLAGVW